MMLAAGAGSVRAQTTNTWTQPDGGTFDWSDSANWQDNDVADGTDVTALFNVTPGGDQTATLDTAVTLGGLSLDWSNRNLTISGTNALTLDVTSGTPTISVNNSGRTLTISNVIAGTDGLNKTGAGTLTFASANSYSGGTVIGGGTLSAVADARLGDSSGNITLDGGTLNSINFTMARDITIGAAGGSFRTPGNANFTTTGKLSGSGTLDYIDVGGAGGRSLRFTSVSNDFTGTILLQNRSSSFRVNSLADSSNRIVFNRSFWGVRFELDSGTASPLVFNSRQIEQAGTDEAIINNNNANTANTITINTDLLVSAPEDTSLTLGGSNTGDNTFAGAITNGTDAVVSVWKQGSGRWILSGENTYSGVTTVEAGTLGLNGDYSLPHAGTLNRTGGTIHIEGRAAVADLQAGGVSLPAGIYGSTDSNAQFNGAMLEIDEETEIANFFSGTGVLYVGTPFPASGTLIVIQ